MQFNAPLTHHEPIARFATGRGRRVFLLASAGGFTIVLVFVGLVNLAELRSDPGSVLAWCYVVISALGLALFGTITLGLLKHHLGRKGNVALVVSPVGVTDRTQMVGELPLIPWSMIVRYDIVPYYGQLLLMLEVADPQAFQQHLGSRFMRVVFRVNSKMFKVPVHSITLQHFQDHPETIAQAFRHYTGLAPGEPRTGDVVE